MKAFQAQAGPGARRRQWHIILTNAVRTLQANFRGRRERRLMQARIDALEPQPAQQHVIRNARITNVGKSQSCMVPAPPLTLPGQSQSELAAVKQAVGQAQGQIQSLRNELQAGACTINRPLVTMHD